MGKGGRRSERTGGRWILGVLSLDCHGRRHGDVCKTRQGEETDPLGSKRLGHRRKEGEGRGRTVGGEGVAHPLLVDDVDEDA